MREDEKENFRIYFGKVVKIVYYILRERNA
jgi:hypothetical protein